MKNENIWANEMKQNYTRREIVMEAEMRVYHASNVSILKKKENLNKKMMKKKKQIKVRQPIENEIYLHLNFFSFLVCPPRISSI